MRYCRTSALPFFRIERVSVSYPGDVMRMSGVSRNAAAQDRHDGVPAGTGLVVRPRCGLYHL